MKFFILAISFLLAAPALAAPELSQLPAPSPYTGDGVTGAFKVRLLPEYTPCSENGVRYACYSLEQQKELLKLELDLKNWQAQAYYLTNAITERSTEFKLVYAQLQLTNANEVIAMRRVDVLTQQLNEEIKAKNDWRAKAETPTIWPYLVGSVVGVLGLGVGLGALAFH
jgi:hypothetical protein